MKRSGAKVAVVSGAGAVRGIGRTVATVLARDGWDLALVDIDGELVREFASDLAASSGRQVIGIQTDIASCDSVETAFATIDRELGGVDAEVNLAGIASPQALLELDEATYVRVMDVNAKGTFLMMRAASKRMQDRGTGGRIINTSSITAYDGGGTYSKVAYAAAKAAVLGLTRGAARELGPIGVTCNALVPGPIDTEIMGGVLSEERRHAMAADIPVGRIGTPDDIAAVVRFLVSDEASFINGAAIAVDGGKRMQ